MTLRFKVLFVLSVTLFGVLFFGFIHGFQSPYMTLVAVAYSGITAIMAFSPESRRIAYVSAAMVVGLASEVGLVLYAGGFPLLASVGLGVIAGSVVTVLLLVGLLLAMVILGGALFTIEFVWRWRKSRGVNLQRSG